MIKRFIPLAVAVALLIPVFLIPVGASSDPVPWNYMDYVTNVTVDGENDIVEFDVPLDFSYIAVYNRELDYREASKTGFLAGEFPQPLTEYSMYINPIDSKHPLSVKNIPKGAILTLDLKVDFVPDEFNINWDFPSGQVDVYYMNDDFKDLARETIAVEFSPEMTIPFEFFRGYNLGSCIAIVISFDNIKPFLWEDYTYTVEITRMHCEMSISSLYRLPEITQQNNKLMTQINKKLDEQGILLEDLMKEQGETNDKLDQIIEGTVAPSAPVGSDSVGDLGDLEDDLFNSAQDGLDQADNIFNNAPGIVALYSSGFLFMANVIEHFSSAGWISGILTVSLALGLLGFIANIAVAVVRSSAKGKGGKG